MNLQSEYATCYANYTYQVPRQALRPAVRKDSKTEAMDLCTMYQHTYVPHALGEKAESYKPEYKYGKNSPMVDATIYRTSYQVPAKERDWSRATPIRHAENIHLNTAKFDAISVMKDDFRAHANPTKQDPIRPKASTNGEMRQPFNATTTYRKEYGVKEPAHTMGFNKKLENAQPRVAFNVTTTQRSDYKTPASQKRQTSFKPQLKYEPNPAKFADMTTAKDAYKEWPVKRREKPTWAEKKTTEKSTEPFTKETIYMAEFVPLPLDGRAKLARPGPGDIALSPNPMAPMLDISQYQEHFKQVVQLERPISFKIIHKYEIPKEAVCTETVYKADYTGKAMEHVKPFTPADRVSSKSHVPMTTETMYSTSYKGDRITSCPAEEVAQGKTEIIIPPDNIAAQVAAAGVIGGHHYYTLQQVARQTAEPTKTTDKVTIHTEETVSSSPKAIETAENTKNVTNTVQDRETSVQKKKGKSTKKTVACTCKEPKDKRATKSAERSTKTKTNHTSKTKSLVAV